MGGGAHLHLHLHLVTTAPMCQAICESFISTFHCCWLGIWVDEICAVLIAACFYRSIKFGEVFSDVFLTDLCFNKFHGGGFQF